MYVDICIREHEHGQVKTKDNGDFVEVLATVIAKYGKRAEIFEKVLDIEKGEMIP